MAKLILLRLACLLLFAAPLAAQEQARTDTSAAHASITWQPWSDDVFARARREHKFVLLDLQAVWCHWCHVMDVTTYSDPHVIALIRARYIAVRVDQDSRPDLASRYQDYGWPATVVFNADGGEIVKRQGYLPPEQMASMLQAIIDDPTPGPSVLNAKPLVLGDGASAANTESLKRQLWNGYDPKLGGWGTVQKFLDWNNVEYCLVAARTGDAQAEKAARQTLQAQLKLVDPVWGGVDQYSAEGDWDHPHFEKIMQFQAENMRIYAKAYAQWKDHVYRQTAEGLARYVRDFLTSPGGAFYTSQDADLVPGVHSADYFRMDDAGRRKLGVPRVDQHIYARENGWCIEALATLSAVTGDQDARDDALRAAKWIIANRSLPGGGFRHGDAANGPASLGDTLAMGRAFLKLYELTADRTWLTRASQAASFIDAHFPYHSHGTVIGYTSVRATPGSPFAPVPDFDENVSLARFANLLSHYTGKPREHVVAENALRFAAAPEVAQSRLSAVGGLLLAQQEIAADPLHIAIVGRKSDKSASALFLAALSYPVIYKQVEWIDRSSGEADAGLYPDLPRAAAYICTNGACSSPAISPADLTKTLDRRTATK
ncbi:MAG TPA: DUF255 domain-containing protein [Candidatus Methylacidiphilales bacterium]|jgi:hypothetical protein|nr:DUF255 domain-containing protein [Candidatus Methylacidiphilales bacterium]